MKSIDDLSPCGCSVDDASVMEDAFGDGSSTRTLLLPEDISPRWTHDPLEDGSVRQPWDPLEDGLSVDAQIRTDDGSSRNASLVYSRQKLLTVVGATATYGQNVFSNGYVDASLGRRLTARPDDGRFPISTYLPNGPLPAFVRVDLIMMPPQRFGVPTFHGAWNGMILAKTEDPDTFRILIFPGVFEFSQYGNDVAVVLDGGNGITGTGQLIDVLNNTWSIPISANVVVKYSGSWFSTIIIETSFQTTLLGSVFLNQSHDIKLTGGVTADGSFVSGVLASPKDGGNFGMSITSIF